MLIKVKVFPRSKRAKIKKKKEDEFEIQARSEAKMGAANKEVIKILAAYFQIPESKVILKRGFKRRNKIFEIKRN